MYHQTDRDSADNILKTQKFLCVTGGLAGAGIYFADSKEETERKCQSRRVMLEADVDLGEWLVVDRNSQVSFPPDPNEYQSVMICDRISGIEYVVYDRLTS